MRISVVGGGYVGLVSCVCLAELGHHIDLIEIDERKVRAINSGRPTIFEKGLDEYLSVHIGKSLYVTDCFDEVSKSDIVFICVGTPQAIEGAMDISMVRIASESIGDSLRNCQGYRVIAIKSTVLPGTTQNFIAPIILKRSGLDSRGLGFVANPEFLREGRAVEDFMNPDRIIIGSEDETAGDLVELAYKKLDAPVMRTSTSAAEMIKYASNAFLAAKISLANEIGNICKKMGIDSYDVMRGVGMDHRISPQFLNVGVGFGGSCFPKDVSALIYLAEKLGDDPIILRSVLKVNEDQPIRIVNMLHERLGDLDGRKIAVLGLSFKNGTDDVRESRSIPVINELKRRGARVFAYDPLAEQAMRKEISDIEYCSKAEHALRDAEGCLVMTEWSEFRSLDNEFSLMKSKVIIEGRRILSYVDKEGICW
ncbi:MAG: UDP-glucose/GDP-mannose dehydrogenase family protein [Methanotrichaceae archaeon]|nr:UDP-glucose/GDP-mannose dehydrogenase family protein [Methanotrichaceae archaeon]